MDFAALQQKLFDLDPSDRAEDLRKLTESMNSNVQQSAPITESLVQESVEVQEGTMPVEGDYSLSDFAALAGVTFNESQKTGSAGQLKGKDPMPKAKARGKHPHVDKLVGEDFKDGFNKSTYNNKELFKKMAGGDAKPKDTPVSIKTSEPVTKSDSRGDNEWQSFLKKHTKSLQAIAADPKKTKRFETWLDKWSEGVEEGDGRKKGIHGKGHPMRKKQQAAIHAGESVESIKDMLYRKLNDKK